MGENSGPYKEWDVESCYNEIEPPNHWVLKKAFLLAHMTKYPKDRLLALANTFYNMEFMGSRYHPETEEMVKSLSADVPEIMQYRYGRKNSLKRTFVAASDASRAKCQKLDTHVPKKSQQQEINKQNNQQQTKRNKNQQQNNKKRFDENKISEEDREFLKRVKSQKGYKGKIVLYISSPNVAPFMVVQDSASKLKMEVKISTTYKFKEDLNEFEVHIGNELVMKDYAKNVKQARATFGPKLLELLQESCFTIMVKSHLDGQSINRTDTEKSQPDPTSDLLPSDNKGTKLMKLMGWKGEGLGKKEDGIQKPIEVSRNVSRMGLCLEGSNTKIFHQKVQEHLEKYIQDDAMYNLVFSNEFSIDERKIVHALALKLHLKSKSYGQGDQRQLVVQKKMDPWQTVQELLANGGETVNLKLVRPTKIT